MSASVRGFPERPSGARSMCSQPREMACTSVPGYGGPRTHRCPSLLDHATAPTCGHPNATLDPGEISLPLANTSTLIGTAIAKAVGEIPAEEPSQGSSLHFTTR